MGKLIFLFSFCLKCLFFFVLLDNCDQEKDVLQHESENFKKKSNRSNNETDRNKRTT